MSPKKTIGADKAERINIFLPPEILEQIKSEAKDKGLNVSALIRMIVIEHLQR